MLERCTIDNIEISYSASLLSFISQHSNLHILSMNQCNLSSIATSSLIDFLQSPNNRLHKLTLDDCNIRIPCTSKLVAIAYQIESISSTDTGNFSLTISGSLDAINYILSQPHQFYTNTLMVLKVAIVSETIDSLQISLYSNLLILEIVSKSKKSTACLHTFLFRLHENNLLTHSLTRCHLCNQCVSSLIHLLQSPNNRLHELILDDCTIQIPDHTNSVAISNYQLKLTSSTDTRNSSLEITSSLYAINYILSQPHQFYANTLAVLKVAILSEITDPLQMSFYPNLVTLEIVSKSKKSTACIHSFPFRLHENNLRTLSLMRCHLSNECVSSLICFLQSPSNRLHELTLDDCTIQIPDHTNSLAISYYQLKLTSPTDTGNFPLEITGSLYAINYMLSQPALFYANTLTILKVTGTILNGTSLQTSLYPNLVTLEIVSKSISNENTACVHSFPFSSHENNLCSLSLTRCHLSNECVSSLICFLQSPNNRLHKLTLDHCNVHDQIPDHTDSVAIYNYQLKLTSPTAAGNFSLEITGSLYAINYILSQPHQFYANKLAILKVVTVSGATNLLQIDISLYPNLESLRISSAEKMSSALCYNSVLISSQQDNLHSLSMKWCNLTCDTVKSMIHSLQSSHCRLQEVTLDDCISDHTHKTTTSSKLKLKSLNSGNVSLEFTGNCCDISHWLSQLSSYTKLTELILYLKRQDSTTADALQEIVLYHSMLESLKIDSIDLAQLPLSIPHFIGLLQSNLSTLSLSRINLSSDVTRSLIYSLQSPHCRLHKLTLDECTISTPDETQQKTISTKNNTTLCSLVTTDSLCVLNHILSNVLFTQMTELSLCITTHNYSLEVVDVLAKIPVSCPVLEILKIDNYSCFVFLPLSIPWLFGSQGNNLHTLSLSGCNLSSDVSWSLIHSMRSLHCKIQNLALKKCNISLPEDTQRTIILTKVNVALHSLDISWSVLDLMMSCINPFTQSLTELILLVDKDTHTCTSGVEIILQEIPSNCPLLETLKIDSNDHISLPLSVPQLIGSQPNNLHTLSMRRCILSSDVTRSLIHSLQSSHCKLYKLALCDCTIPTTDHTQITTAIASSTTITHLLWSLIKRGTERNGTEWKKLIKHGTELLSRHKVLPRTHGPRSYTHANIRARGEVLLTRLAGETDRKASRLLVPF